MAPTICMADIPNAGTDAPCVRRKFRNQGINRHQKVELKQISIKNGSWEAHCPESSLSEARIPGEPRQEQFRNIERRRKELLDIVIRTLVLVRRNHVLQKRVDALYMESQHFIRSQLINRQNKNASKDASIVSSTTDDMEVDNTRQNNVNESGIKSQNHVTSTCILSDTDSDVSSHCFF